MKSKEFEPTSGPYLPRMLDRLQTSIKRKPKRTIAGIDMGKGKSGTAVVEYIVFPFKVVGKFPVRTEIGIAQTNGNGIDKLAIVHRAVKEGSENVSMGATVCSLAGCSVCDLLRKF